LSVAGHSLALGREARSRAARWILGHRIRARHPTLICDPTAIWDYGYRDIDAIQIGVGVSVLAHANITVHRYSPRSRVEGKLILGDGAIVSAGVVIIAAGGVVRIGKNSAVAANSVAVAANHLYAPGASHLHGAWDEERCGVIVGDNVWVGAGCVLLPGCLIGDDTVIGAGSVVRGTVTPGEIWAGVPARRIMTLTGFAAQPEGDATKS
jgi:acetyltransferase-like isoleucine patch superfamily enzyme